MRSRLLAGWVLGVFLSLSVPAWAGALPDAPSVRYEVRSGDNLTRIAKTHGVTPGLIRSVNGLQSDSLRSGQKLVIPTYKLSVSIDKSDNRLVLLGDGQPLKTYIVSTGTQNSTPVGTFKITDKLENPTWYKAGAVIPSGSKDNQLGTRWMGFDLKGYGIHGTTEPEKLGQQASAGCIRMKNEEVEEIFAWLPSGAAVVIQD